MERTPMPSAGFELAIPAINLLKPSGFFTYHQV